MTVVTNPACTSDVDILAQFPRRSRSYETGGHGADYGIDGSDELLPEVIDVNPSPPLSGRDLTADITFVAGIGDDTEHFLGHRRALAGVTPVFDALVKSDSDVIVVDNVDRRGFEMMIRYIYCDKVDFDSAIACRCALDASYKFLCPMVAEQAARHLDEMLTVGIALDVLRDLRFLCARLPGAASAPPLPVLSNDAAARYLAKCLRWCDSLAHNALLVIDDNADDAFQSSRLEELPYEDLVLIVRRDTLRVSSELVLVDALSRWAAAYCKRMSREVTSANKRAALGALSYCPRYLLLQGEDLDKALGMELLEPIERTLVLARARKLSAPIPVGVEQENLLKRWAVPRPTQPAELPVHLSVRSVPPAADDDEPERPSHLCGRRARPTKPVAPSFTPESSYNSDKKPSCCSSFCDGLLRALICLFD